MKKISVVAAIIIHEKKFLCVQRGYNKLSYISRKYEFPGGKMEEDETPDETIIREIWEELHIEIKPEKRYITVQHQYPDFFINMDTFICSCTDTKIVLTEHLNYQWLDVSQLATLDWAAADIPIVKALENEYESR